MLKNLVILNSYYDSATLMLLTNQIKQNLSLKSDEISIMMATEMNKRIMDESGLLDETGRNANPGDVLIAIKSDLEDKEILGMINELLNKKVESKKTTDVEVTSVDEAVEVFEESNFAVVSIPGAYAAREVKKLLNANKHVLLFSDNVSIEDENKLKDLAIEKDLLMMGPDCGTAIIKGVGLGFANKVNKGNIGIVAASGTGLQEVATIISNNGGGISYAFGTGGRDIKDEVGGKMMLYCLDLLMKDEETKTIVIVSKPPSKSVMDKIFQKLKDNTKPVVACFLGEDADKFKIDNWTFCETLEGVAVEALKVSGIEYKENFDVEKAVSELEMNKNTKYLRAIYCGGTLAYETLLMLEKENFDVYSNLAKKPEKKLGIKDSSKCNTVLDMGEDEYTVGKPHPMINSASRSEQLLKEAEDSEVGIMIADVELGYGSNDLATDDLADVIKTIKSKREDIIFIGVICGSKQDYQNYELKRNLLKEAGAIVVDSNAQGIRLAIQLLKKL